MLVAEVGNNRVQEFNVNGEYIEALGGSGSGKGEFDLGYTVGIAVGVKGDMWVTDSSNNRVEEWVAGVLVNQTAPMISGVERDGQTLSVSDGEWKSTMPLTYAYQWERCNAAGGECEDIDDGTSASYTLVNGDVGGLVRVVVTASNGAGSAWVSSAASSRVAPVAPVNTSLPSISGSAVEGQTLTASTGEWSGAPAPSYIFQWERCDSGGEACSDIKGATGASYQLGAVDVGDTLRVRVVATNAASSATDTSVATVLVESTGAVAPSNTKLPSISGDLEDGQTLSADPGSWEGTAPISYVYQWESCDEAGSDCEAIDGATSAAYMLGPTDEGTRLRVLVAASGPGGYVQATSEASGLIQVGAPSELEAPSIAGSPSVGEALQAEVGSWSGSEAQFSYQWERCNEAGTKCQSIPGATESKYVPAESDADSSLRLKLGAHNSEGSVTALSAVTSPVQSSEVLLNTAAPMITGAASNGETLTAHPGGWLGSSTIAYTYKWERCDLYGTECKVIEGASASTYALSSTDVGHTLRVRVNASEIEGAASERSTTTVPVAASGAPLPEALPSVVGTGLVGDTLSATAGIWADEEGTTSYSYQWVRCNEEGEECSSISGATEDSYTLSTEDAGFEISVLVSATNLNGTSEAASSPVIASGKGIADAAQPWVSGSDQLGRPLQANVGIWTASGAIAFAYEWQRCDEEGESCEAVSGAAESTYSPGEADSGHTLRVKITATGLEGSVSSTSPVTPPIESEATAPENATVPSIEGDLTNGDTLKASVGSWSGSEPISYAYTWQRCNRLGAGCVEIEGANSSTYELTETDIESRIRVLVEASNSAGSESATSEASEEVGAIGAPANIQEPVVTGRAIEGQRLFVENGRWSGSKPLIYYYRWERCNAAGESCATITGANRPSYMLVASDIGATVHVNVTAANGLGSAGSVSPHTDVVVSATQAGTSAALEDIEGTDPSLLARSTSATIEEQSLTPAITDSGEEIVSESALASSEISKVTPGEFSLETADGPLSLTPVKPSLGADTVPTIANGTAALFAETWSESDTIVRPSALGAITLLQLRSEYAPTSESWEVGLGANQQLEQLSNGSVAIVEPTPGESLESSLSEEGTALGSSEAPAQEEGEGFDGHGGEEELDSSLAEESALGPLSAAPMISVTESSPKEHELHPQDTKEHYEHDESAMSYAEEHTSYTALIVVEAPIVVDAAGHSVPATFAVEGDTITLTISPEPEVSYPITAEIATAAPTDSVSLARDPVKYGLSDPKASVFENLDPGLTKAPLKIKIARDVVPYYAWQSASDKEELLQWLKAVGVHPNLRPYITVESGGSSVGYDEYKADMTELIKELMNGKASEGIPEVKMWGAMNEPDLPPSGLTASAEKAAILWKIADAVGAEVHCGCQIAAGEFHAYDSYVPKYINTIRSNHSYTNTKPNVWGLHDYYDPENLQRHTEERKGNVDLGKFLKEVTEFFPAARIWISETGVVLQNDTTPTSLKTSGSHAKLQVNAANDVLKLAEGHSRVELIDYYLYEGPTEKYLEEYGAHSFDSALVAGSGVVEKQKPREAYCVLVLDKHKGCPASVSKERTIKGKVAESKVAIGAIIDPNDQPTTYAIEYGPTEAYGKETTVTNLPSEEGEQSMISEIEGLDPCTTYHYRVIAENEGNEGVPSSGGNGIFNTKGCPAIAIGAGAGAEVCVVVSDGDVECWGNENVEPTVVEGVSDATAVVVGFGQTCALLGSGHVECWGDNSHGELGDGTTKWKEGVVTVVGVEDATALTAGSYYMCALLATGRVKCWGDNGVGQLGDGTTTDKSTPVDVYGISDAVAIGARANSTCAVLEDGSVECWGDNESEELGYPTFDLAYSATPVVVEGVSKAATVQMGSMSGCVRLTTDEVECWGDDLWGHTEIREAEEEEHRYEPVMIEEFSGVAELSVSQYNSCALLTDGGIDCWGANDDGQHGNGTESEVLEATPTPVPVTGIGDATAVAAAGSTSCALVSGGRVECWGSNWLGGLGDGSSDYKEISMTPVAVKGLG